MSTQNQFRHYRAHVQTQGTFTPAAAALAEAPAAPTSHDVINTSEPPDHSTNSAEFDDFMKSFDPETPGQHTATSSQHTATSSQHTAMPGQQDTELWSAPAQLGVAIESFLNDPETQEASPQYGKLWPGLETVAAHVASHVRSALYTEFSSALSAVANTRYV
jgi:hypothetical protein